jgi:hypothetical protein
MSRLVNDIVPQVKQLPDDFVGLASNSIVVHDIGCEGLASLDLLCRLARVVIVDIHLSLAPLVEQRTPLSSRTHIFLVYGCIYRNLILAKLLFVEQGRPVRVCRNTVGDILDLAKLAVILEHPAEYLCCVSWFAHCNNVFETYHLAGEVDGSL